MSYAGVDTGYLFSIYIGTNGFRAFETTRAKRKEKKSGQRVDVRAPPAASGYSGRVASTFDN